MKTEANLFDGPGGPLDPSHDPAEDERRRQQEREWNERVAQYAAQVQELCDKIDATMAPYLKNQMAVENEKARISAAIKRDFKEFEIYCTKFDPPLPHLPARPQAVAAFLCAQMDRGSAHVSRLARSIATGRPRRSGF